jgi:hypothetical protein
MFPQGLQPPRIRANATAAETERIEVHRHIIPDQQITAVATDAKWVYAASSPGGGGGAKPKGRTGHFFVWDPTAKKIVYDLELEPGRGIGAMTSVNGCVYFVLGRAFSEYNHTTGKLRTVVGRRYGLAPDD